VRAGGLLFITGQLGIDPKTARVVQGGVAAEMRQVMKNLEVVLKGAGSSFEKVVMARIFLVHFANDYPTVNRMYAEYFEAGRYPARTTVGVTALAMGCLVEVDLIARL
jgi:2-iminobutanoate/2-iminopropanoate deaminase